MNRPIDIKTRMDNHLTTVKKQMKELPPEEQQDLLQTLKTQIQDALKERPDGQPTHSTLEAIIEAMEPPESYGSAPLISPPNRPPFSSIQKIIFFSSIGTLFLLFVAIWLADPFSSHWMEESEPVDAPALIQQETAPEPSTGTNAPTPSSY
ncbi:MAG: hypothetical protein V5783_07625 [Pontiella sp.]